MGSDLSQVGILVRREIEARVLMPVITAFIREVGEERTRQIMEQAIVSMAGESGAQLAAYLGGNTLTHLASGLALWTKGDALRMEAIEQTPESYAFHVTRCRYAEMYRELGMEQWGTLLSCNRDFAFIEGFNPEIGLTRTHTIMEGASFCDFCYKRK